MDWIKAEKQTPRKREVIRIAARLRISRRESYAACMEFWMWADGETDNGQLDNCDEQTIDTIMELPGFADALLDAGWLAKDGSGLTIPNWEHHLGAGAKQRMIAARRVQRHRVRRANERNAERQDR